MVDKWTSPTNGMWFLSNSLKINDLRSGAPAHPWKKGVFAVEWGERRLMYIPKYDVAAGGFDFCIYIIHGAKSVSLIYVYT